MTRPSNILRTTTAIVCLLTTTSASIACETVQPAKRISVVSTAATIPAPVTSAEGLCGYDEADLILLRQDMTQRPDFEELFLEMLRSCPELALAISDATTASIHAGEIDGEKAGGEDVLILLPVAGRDGAAFPAGETGTGGPEGDAAGSGVTAGAADTPPTGQTEIVQVPAAPAPGAHGRTRAASAKRNMPSPNAASIAHERAGARPVAVASVEPAAAPVPRNVHRENRRNEGFGPHSIARGVGSDNGQGSGLLKLTRIHPQAIDAAGDAAESGGNDKADRAERGNNGNRGRSADGAENAGENNGQGRKG